MEGPISGMRSSWLAARPQEPPASRSFKLRKLLLRYYPPGIILEYEDQAGALQQSSLDLLNLDADTDVEVRDYFQTSFSMLQWLKYFSTQVIEASSAIEQLARPPVLGFTQLIRYPF